MNRSNFSRLNGSKQRAGAKLWIWGGIVGSQNKTFSDPKSNGISDIFPIDKSGF